MVKKFQNISYDIRQNLILNEEFVRLSHYSLILSVVHHFKNSNIIQEFISLSIEAEYPENVQWLLDRSVKDIYPIVHKCFVPKSNIFDAYINSTVSFVLSEVFQFIKRAKVYLMEEQYLFLRHLVLTNQGTVNIKKTILRYFKRKPLSPVQKFKLASQFFLEENVEQCFKELSEEEKGFFADIKFEKNFAASFWKHRLENREKSVLITRSFIRTEKGREISQSCDRINEDTLHLRIFLMAVEEHNESAVYYLWNNFISKLDERKEILKKVLLDYMVNFNHVNIIHYLLFETETDELSDFFDEQSFRILALTYGLERWRRPVFLKVLEVLKVHINYFQYQEFLTFAFFYYLETNAIDINFELIKSILCKMPKHQEQFFCKLLTLVNCSYDLHQVPYIKKAIDGIEEDEGEEEEEEEEDEKEKEVEEYGPINFFYDILRVPFEEQNIDFVQSFFHNCNRSTAFQIFLSNWGLDLLEVAIRKSNFDFIEIFFKNAGFNENEKRKIIESFLRSNGYKFCESFLFNEFHIVNRFIEWLSSLEFINKPHLKNFLVNLLFEKGGNLIKQMLFKFSDEPNYNPLTLAENVFAWFENKTDIEYLKSMIILHIEEKNTGIIGVKCYSQVSKLVIKSKWSYIQELLEWKGCKDEDKYSLGIKLLTDLNLFEKMVKNSSNPSYYQHVGGFARTYLCISDRTSEYVSFKLRVFRRREIYTALIFDKEYADIINIIEWCNPTDDYLTSYSLLIQRLSKKMSGSKFDTSEEREKQRMLLQWIEGKLEP